MRIKIKKTSIYDIPYYVTNNNYVSKVYQWRPKNISNIIEDIYFWILKNKNNLKIFLMAVAIITGSTGLVGSEAVNLFCDKGFDVIE